MARATVLRSLHDLGLAAWFGGSVMGAVGLEGAAGSVDDPAEAARLSQEGWDRWTPVAVAAIGAHAVGGLGLVVVNRGRLSRQPGARRTAVVKAGVTGAAVAATGYTAWLGTRIASMQRLGDDLTEAERDELEVLRRRIRLVAWSVPALTGAVVVLGAVQGEQQRPVEVARGAATAALVRAGGAISTAAHSVRSAVEERIDTDAIAEALGHVKDVVLEHVNPEAVGASFGHAKDVVTDHVNADVLSASFGHAKDVALDHLDAESAGDALTSAKDAVGDALAGARDTVAAQVHKVDTDAITSSLADARDEVVERLPTDAVSELADKVDVDRISSAVVDARDTVLQKAHLA